jgi:hypothetical protein
MRGPHVKIENVMDTCIDAYADTQESCSPIAFVVHGLGLVGSSLEELDGGEALCLGDIMFMYVCVLCAFYAWWIYFPPR